MIFDESSIKIMLGDYGIDVLFLHTDLKGTKPMVSYNLGNNCYRAILAQVNYLDGIWPERSRLKDLYEELAELAFYMLERDHCRVIRSVDQIRGTINEMDSAISNEANRDQVTMIFSELKTHLHYLALIYSHAAPLNHGSCFSQQ